VNTRRAAGVALAAAIIAAPTAGIAQNCAEAPVLPGRISLDGGYFTGVGSSGAGGGAHGVDFRVTTGLDRAGAVTGYVAYSRYTPAERFSDGPERHSNLLAGARLGRHLADGEFMVCSAIGAAIVNVRRAGAARRSGAGIVFDVGVPFIRPSRARDGATRWTPFYAPGMVVAYTPHHTTGHETLLKLSGTAGISAQRRQNYGRAGFSFFFPGGDPAFLWNGPTSSSRLTYRLHLGIGRVL
jgi:hypothetical protein